MVTRVQSQVTQIVRITFWALGGRSSLAESSVGVYYGGYTPTHSNEQKKEREHPTALLNKESGNGNPMGMHECLHRTSYNGGGGGGGQRF